MDMDKTTGLLLGMRTLNSSQQIIERFRYAEIDFKTSSPNTDYREIESSEEIEIRNNGDDSKVIRWKANWIPAGFERIEETKNSNRGSFTDGLASFSIFLAPVLQGESLKKTEGAIVWGGMTSYVNTVKLAANWVLITVVGDIPASAAKRIALSIKEISDDAR